MVAGLGYGDGGERVGEGEEENEKKKRQKRSIHGEGVIMVVMNDEKEWVLREREKLWHDDS